MIHTPPVGVVPAPPPRDPVTDRPPPTASHFPLLPVLLLPQLQPLGLRAGSFHVTTVCSTTHPSTPSCCTISQAQIRPSYPDLARLQPAQPRSNPASLARPRSSPAASSRPISGPTAPSRPGSIVLAHLRFDLHRPSSSSWRHFQPSTSSLQPLPESL
jgi:hypothetical protein